MDFYLTALCFLTDLAVNAKSYLNSNRNLLWRVTVNVKKLTFTVKKDIIIFNGEKRSEKHFSKRV